MFPKPSLQAKKTKSPEASLRKAMSCTAARDAFERRRQKQGKIRFQDRREHAGAPSSEEGVGEKENQEL
ncbi:hypothetical protein C7120_08110 [Prevotella sp. oral taxon 376]|nr:hypothetical protein C7120_08110 [Prevotella sp. oral taxon 376]